MTETLRVGYIGINFVSSSFSVPSQFLPSYFPKLIRAKVHDGNSEGQLHWYKMSFLKSILKQNAVYQSNFQMSRQCLQRSDVFYLTLQRFTLSTYICDGLQSEDFQTFEKHLCRMHCRNCTAFQEKYIMIIVKNRKSCF